MEMCFSSAPQLVWVASGALQGCLSRYRAATSKAFKTLWNNGFCNFSSFLKVFFEAMRSALNKLKKCVNLLLSPATARILHGWVCLIHIMCRVRGPGSFILPPWLTGNVASKASETLWTNGVSAHVSFGFNVPLTKQTLTTGWQWLG